MKRQLGVSVYPDHSDINKDKEYLAKAAEQGFSRIFMSMLEITEDQQKVKEKFQDIISYAKKLGYEVILDIAPNIFADLGISYDDLTFFKELGADGIRLDVGFDGSKEAMMTYNPQELAIELNMSNNVAYLDNILTFEANEPFLYGCHNFYPQKGTALPLPFFIECSERFKKHGLKTAAFVNSQVGKIGPWDVNDGLPTLEMHRELPVTVQAKHLFTTGLIDDVIIGNAYASDEELVALGKLNRYLLEFNVDFVAAASDLEKEILLDHMQMRRGDITDQVIRSTQTRVIYSKEKNPEHDNEQVFQRGDVVVGNDSFGKYKNELQVVLQPHSDSRKNLVAKIKPEEVFLLDYVNPWSKFSFETEKR